MTDNQIVPHVDGQPQDVGWAGRQRLWMVFWGYGILGVPIVVRNPSSLRIPYWGAHGFGTLVDTPAFILVWAFCFYLMSWSTLLAKSSSKTGSATPTPLCKLLQPRQVF